MSIKVKNVSEGGSYIDIEKKNYNGPLRCIFSMEKCQLPNIDTEKHH